MMSKSARRASNPPSYSESAGPTSYQFAINSQHGHGGVSQLTSLVEAFLRFFKLSGQQAADLPYS